MFYTNYIQRIYIINGLARSGNHLFISWLISSFSLNEVYYINNIKPTLYQIGTINQDTNIIKKYHTVTNDNKYGLKLDKDVRKNLVSKNDMNLFLDGKKNINILIISVENKFTDKINTISTIFTKYEKLYKCIVIRDILNLFSSRIESEKLLSKITFKKYNKYNKNNKPIRPLTDEITTEYWLDAYRNINNKNYIVFNYNKFVCNTITRKVLAKKLNIDYDKALITLNLYGLTAGSSFKNTITNNSDYFMRWIKNKDNPLIKSLINNDKIIKILCKDFSTCLNFAIKKIKICRKLYNFD